MRQHHFVRTTLDIDDDVLAAAKDLARVGGISAGKALSALARESLQPKGKGIKRNGFTLMPKRGEGVPVTMELVNRLRDELE